MLFKKFFSAHHNHPKSDQSCWKFKEIRNLITKFSRENSKSWVRHPMVIKSPSFYKSFFTSRAAPPGWATLSGGKWSFLVFSCRRAETAACWSPPGWRASSRPASGGAWQGTCGWRRSRRRRWWGPRSPETRWGPLTFLIPPLILHPSRSLDARELHLECKQRNERGPQDITRGSDAFQNYSQWSSKSNLDHKWKC